MKHNFILLFSLLLFACKPQKSIVEYKEVIKTDTLVKTQINTIYKGVTDTLVIDNPCDSSGILTNFYSKIVSPNATIKIEGRNNKIKVSAKVLDAETNITDTKQYSATKNTNSLQKEVIKYRIPSWIIYVLLIETFILLIIIFRKVNLF